jgi:flagellar hook-associated protein 2
VTFVSAGDRARAGTYAVNITQVATQATNTGLTGTWPIGAPPTVKVRQGSNEITYAIGATDVQADVVRALNAKFELAGMQLSASVNGAGIAITSNEYGSAAHFDVAWDGTTYNAYAGLDVQGTIGGVTATGKGRRLSIPFDNNDMGGLALQITATSTGSLGNFEYQPGSGARVLTTLFDAMDAISGYITSTENGLKSRVKFIDDQVASMNVRLDAYQARLKTYYANLETTLSSLQQQGQWLQGQIANLNG